MRKQNLITRYMTECEKDILEYKDLVGNANKEQLLKFLDGVPDYRTKEDLEYIALYRIDWDLNALGIIDPVRDLIGAVYPSVAELEDILMLDREELEWLD